MTDESTWAKQNVIRVDAPPHQGSSTQLPLESLWCTPSGPDLVSSRSKGAKCRSKCLENLKYFLLKPLQQFIFMQRHVLHNAKHEAVAVGSCECQQTKKQKEALFKFAVLGTFAIVGYLRTRS